MEIDSQVNGDHKWKLISTVQNWGEKTNRKLDCGVRDK